MQNVLSQKKDRDVQLTWNEVGVYKICNSLWNNKMQIGGRAGTLLLSQTSALLKPRQTQRHRWSTWNTLLLLSGKNLEALFLFLASREKINFGSQESVFENSK